MVAKLDNKSWTQKMAEEVRVQVEPSDSQHLQRRIREEIGSTEVMIQTAITEHDATYSRTDSCTVKDKSSGRGFCGFVRRLLKKSEKNQKSRRDKKHLSLQELHEAELMLQRSSSFMAAQGVQWQGTPFCTQNFVFPLNERGVWGPPELPPHPQRVPAELHWLLGTLPRRREYELCAPGGSFFPPPADDEGGGERIEPTPSTTQFNDDLEERFRWFYDQPPPSAFRRQGWPAQPSTPQMPPYEPYLHYCLGNLPPRSVDSEFEVVGAGEGEGGHGGGRVHPSTGTTHMRTVPAGSPIPGRGSGGAAHPQSSVSAHVTGARSQEEDQQEQQLQTVSAQASRVVAAASPRRITRSALRRSARIGSARRRRSGARRRRGATIAPGVKAPGPMASAVEAVADSPTDGGVGGPRGAESASGGSGGSASASTRAEKSVEVDEMVPPNAMAAAPTSASQMWLSVRRSLETKSPRVAGQRPGSYRRRRPAAPMSMASAPGSRGLGALVAAARSPINRRKEEMSPSLGSRTATSQTDSKEKLSPQSWDSVVTIRCPRRHRIPGSNRRRVVGQMGSQRDLECLVELSSEDVASSTCQPSSAGEGTSRFKRRKDAPQFTTFSAPPVTSVQTDARIETRPHTEQGTEASASRPRSACGDYKQ